MRKRSENIAFKLMPDGNIRAYQSDTPDKRGVSELQITDIRNESPTVISSTPPKIIIYDDYNGNIPKNQDVCGTVTTMFGRDSLRHGFKIIEVYEEDNVL